MYNYKLYISRFLSTKWFSFFANQNVLIDNTLEPYAPKMEQPLQREIIHCLAVTFPILHHLGENGQIITICVSYCDCLTLMAQPLTNKFNVYKAFDACY